MAGDYTVSRAAALRIVASAHTITRHVQQAETETRLNSASKKDNSPVTVADYAAQTFITLRLAALFPQDAFIAEETSAALRESPALLDDVVSAVQVGIDDSLGEFGEMEVTGDDVLGAIDLAAVEPARDGRRTWMYVLLHFFCRLASS